MLTVSNQWREYTKDNQNFEIKAVLTLTDGTVFNLTGDDFMSACISDAVSEMDSITIGAVVTNRFSGSLNNMDDKFTGYDLESATLTVQVGLIYEDETEEWLDKGTFTLDQPSMMGAVLKISAYDNMDKLNRYYVGTHPVDGVQELISFPVSSETLASYLCDYCGVSYDADFWQLSNNLPVDSFEYNESTTCREVLNWVLQINCGYARMSNQNKLECKWFSPGLWIDETYLNGGTINPWDGAEAFDGGSIDPWSIVAVTDGGKISKGWDIDLITSIDMATKDAAVTGVRTYAYGTVSEFDFETAGTDGYILALQDNPLITSDKLSVVASAVYKVVGGFRLRPYSASVAADPSLEAGDCVEIMDYKGEFHHSYVMNLTFTWGAAMHISAGAESATNKSVEMSNPTTSVIAESTRAAYDYITAKRISADYIDAGTIEAAVVAKDLTMEGGSINIDTDSESNDLIRLNYAEESRTISALFYPMAFQVTCEQNGLQIGYISYNMMQLRKRGVVIAELSETQMLTAGKAYATAFVNTSLIDLKRDLNKVGSMLSKIVGADILSFNFLNEDKDSKAHFGLAVGGNYNTPEEVIALDPEGKEKGIDLYSMVSMAWKAIQEQQEIIESLENRIETLEKKLNPFGKITDIIKGDNDGNTI